MIFMLTVTKKYYRNVRINGCIYCDLLRLALNRFIRIQEIQCLKFLRLGYNRMSLFTELPVLGDFRALLQVDLIPVDIRTNWHIYLIEISLFFSCAPNKIEKELRTQLSVC